MFGSSMLLTVGQALDHARAAGARVRLCVGGEWITGRVLHTDGQGLVMTDESGDTCVIRADAVSCVRIPSSTNDASGAAEDPAPTAEQRAGEPGYRVPTQPIALGTGG